MRKRTTAVLLALAAVAILALPVAAATPKLPGSVGPGFTISMKKPTKAGKYSLVVSDKSDEHNFHLKGPGGVNVKTTVGFTGTKTFAIKVVKGKYTFVCDPHVSTMKGSFTIR
jgi:Copper binding proteins, plastocyanin/azurin family